MKNCLSALFISLIIFAFSATALADMPDWYPQDVSSFENFNDASAPRVVDTADIFSDEEEAEMLVKISNIQKTYSRDMVVFTDVSTYGLSESVYAADFYTFNGYGFGESNDGTILFISMEPGNRCWWSAATGLSFSLFNEENINGLDDRLEPYMIEGDYGEGVLDYLDNMCTLYEYGEFPPRLSDYTDLFLIGAGVSLFLGFTIAGMAKSKMKTIRTAANANRYITPDSFKMTRSNDIFLYMTVIRTPKPKNSNRGGGSKFSGGYSSSSGGSFSGGGRSF